MGELNLTELFMNGMITYGSIVLGIALLIGAAGIPVPGTLLIVAAGALVQQGIVCVGAAAKLIPLTSTPAKAPISNLVFISKSPLR